MKKEGDWVGRTPSKTNRCFGWQREAAGIGVFIIGGRGGESKGREGSIDQVNVSMHVYVQKRKERGRKRDREVVSSTVQTKSKSFVVFNSSEEQITEAATGTWNLLNNNTTNLN